MYRSLHVSSDVAHARWMARKLDPRWMVRKLDLSFCGVCAARRGALRGIVEDIVDGQSSACKHNGIHHEARH